MFHMWAQHSRKPPATQAHPLGPLQYRCPFQSSSGFQASSSRDMRLTSTSSSSPTFQGPSCMAPRGCQAMRRPPFRMGCSPRGVRGSPGMATARHSGSNLSPAIMPSCHPSRRDSQAPLLPLLGCSSNSVSSSSNSSDCNLIRQGNTAGALMQIHRNLVRMSATISTSPKACIAMHVCRLDLALYVTLCLTSWAVLPMQALECHLSCPFLAMTAGGGQGMRLPKQWHGRASWTWRFLGRLMTLGQSRCLTSTARSPPTPPRGGVPVSIKCGQESTTSCACTWVAWLLFFLTVMLFITRQNVAWP